MPKLIKLDSSKRQDWMRRGFAKKLDQSKTVGMTETVNIETVRAALKAVMDRKGVKPTTLSQQVGRSSSLVKDLLERTSDVSIKTLVKLASALDVEVSELLYPQLATPLGPRLYVKGEVAAGVWSEANELPPEEWQSFTGRADIKADIGHRFGLRVVGNSMDLVYPPGTIVECVSIFGGVQPLPGKRVIVVRKNYHGECEATVKELVEQEGVMWAVPRSSNPEHLPIRLNESNADIIETRITAVVVGSYRAE